MSTDSCFICYNVVLVDTNVELREKYRQVTGLNLNTNRHLCKVCGCMLNIIWMFKAVCKRRSIENPEFFTKQEKNPENMKNLQINELQFYSICSEDSCLDPSDYNAKCFILCHEEAVLDNQDYDEGNYETNCYDEYFFEQVDDGVSVKEVKEETYNTSEINQDSPEKIVLDTDIPVETDKVINNDDNINEHSKKVKKKKSKKNKYEKIILTLEQQKAELERRRREKKYLEAQFKCYNCALGFLFKDTYQAHMMRHEESNGEYRCTTCTLRFATPAVLRSHSASHAERGVCTKCGAAVRPRARTTHARGCWGAAGDVAACHLCAGVFSEVSGLHQHLKRFHQMKAGHRSYSCSVCGQRCATQAAVRTHMIKHINRKFECESCPSTFSSPYTLAQHKKKHGGEREQHMCEICHVTFGSRKSLLAHKRNTLNHQQSMFECSICGRNCPNQRALSLHIEAIHTGTKNYACPHCPARYSNRKSLVRHVGTHANKPQAKTAVCHMCGASFKGNNKLNRHLKQVCEKSKLEEEFASFYEQQCIE